MNPCMARRPGLRLRFALFFAALAFGGVALVEIGLWLGHARSDGRSEGYVIAGVFAVFGLAGMAAWVGYLFDERVARPMLALSAALLTRAKSQVTTEIDTGSARYVGELAEAAKAVHAALEEARASLDRALAEKTVRMASDKALLEALLRELADGVVVISPDGRILLYNRVAAALLGPLGLDRPLERYLRTDPVLAAIERQGARDGVGGSTLFLTSPVRGNKIFSGTVSVVELGDRHIGHVLHYRDMTEDLRVHGEHERLLRRTIEGARRPASAMGAVLDVIEAVPDMRAGERARFNAALREELERLTGMLADSAAEEQALNASHWPIRELAVQQVFDALLVRASEHLEALPSDAVARCDGYAVTEILAHVAQQLAAKPGHESLALSAADKGDEVHLHLTWRGPTLALGELDAWLSKPVATAYGDYTGRDALAAHRSDVWVEPVDRGARIVLPLAAAHAPGRLHTPAPVQFYDFGLQAHADRDLGPRRLSELTYTVFDTETTGLDANRDAVVQIAGVRIVGGRLLRDEVFDRLVNPGRGIPAVASEVHGISDAMVADAPDFDEIAREFLFFAEGSVLVAHHAAFDMAFLNRQRSHAGEKLSVPVLCTALLSSRLFAHSNDHTLDGLAARCGVDVESTLRHTALGDSLATAEAFQKLIPLLEALGIQTLDAALTWQRAG
ncbi:MAG: 3'-5' exonuclease [Boseongicola sp. SB0664_bin_43]|uniref:DNA-directed DNA polymerase n=1 Tax=Boseongicola sp. SB0664_bin_43 TaxID=2604844 RepID=A0A6B0XYF6_9RHOB|nr:3'-5' exonuclease [Boseongicola sp. SB0664_bin_43]